MASKVKIDLEELFRVGMHFGHQTFRWHPKMQPFIFGVREGIHIIDLEKTAELLEGALEVIEDRVAEGGLILLVGTKRQARDLVAETAEKTEMPYVNIRWPGGLLTNFSTIKKRIQYLEQLLSGEAKEIEESLTKKERAVLVKEREKLERNFKGLLPLKELPAMVFIIDVNREKTAIREASRLGIPLVAMVDTNADPTPIDFVIPANDDAIQSICFILKQAEGAIERGRARWEKEEKKKEKEEEEKEAPSLEDTAAEKVEAVVERAEKKEEKEKEKEIEAEKVKRKR